MDDSYLKTIRENIELLDKDSYSESYKGLLTKVVGINSVILKNQVLVFGLFCLYKKFQLSELPPEILNFQDTLYNDIDCICREEFLRRWSDFSSDNFIKSLDFVSGNDKNLQLIIDLLKIHPHEIGGPSIFLELLKRHQSQSSIIFRISFPYERRAYNALIDLRCGHLLSQ